MLVAERVGAKKYGGQLPIVVGKATRIRRKNHLQKYAAQKPKSSIGNHFTGLKTKLPSTNEVGERKRIGATVQA